MVVGLTPFGHRNNLARRVQRRLNPQSDTLTAKQHTTLYWHIRGSRFSLHLVLTKIRLHGR
jgi:hypothetical protein